MNVNKIILRLFVLTIPLFLLLSCETVTYYNGHYLERLCKIDSIYALQSFIKIKEHQAIITLESSLIPCSEKELQSAWIHYGDTICFNPRIPNKGKDPHIIVDCRLTSISITALDTFNDEYLEGSVLNDLFSIVVAKSEIPEWIDNGCSGQPNPALASYECPVSIIDPGIISLLETDITVLQFALICHQIPNNHCRIMINIKNAFGQTFSIIASINP